MGVIIVITRPSFFGESFSVRRIYEGILQEHRDRYEQMAFVAGPRQVGKTTLSKAFAASSPYFKHFNWDSLGDRARILKGYSSLVEGLPIDAVVAQKPIIVLDEIHKYKNWKNYLKGFIDEYKGRLHILVTGSAKLNIFRRGGDSLMGRYFLYQVHPLSVAECLRTAVSLECLSTPQSVEAALMQHLLEWGGFPEPFMKQDKRFYHQWQNLRQEQLFKEDIRALSQIQDLAQLELLAYHLKYQSGQLLNYSHLANKIRVSEPTIRRWVQVLKSFYYCFQLAPWSKNIPRSLLKEPKIYLYDWSIVEDEGQRIENFVASHLLKAVDLWTNLGFGKFGLYFVRDKEKREVDFLITKDMNPWILIEVKKSEKESLNKNLFLFQLQTQAPFALQVAFDAPYVECDFRTLTKPTIIPLASFLSQLV